MADYASSETERLLDHLCTMARSGKLTGIAFVGIIRGRQFTSGWAGEAGQDPLFTLGALQHLNHDLITRGQD